MTLFSPSFLLPNFLLHLSCLPPPAPLLPSSRLSALRVFRPCPHPVQAAQVLDLVFVRAGFVVDDGVLLVHAARLRTQTNAQKGSNSGLTTTKRRERRRAVTIRQLHAMSESIDTSEKSPHESVKIFQPYLRGLFEIRVFPLPVFLYCDI